MTYRRHLRFDPPIEEPLNDGVMLLVRGVRHGTRGWSAALQLWNDHLLYLVHPLDSGTLAAALTTTMWEDRILGQSRTIRVPVRCAWVATANNPVLSRELTRRSVRIRIDPKVDRPWLRQAFHHDDLRAWVNAHRADLVWAALTLVRAWLAAGGLQPSIRPLGSYEAWSRVIGGVLSHAGIAGFLGNLNEFYASANAENAAWRSLVAVWWDRYKDTPMTTAELLPLAREFDELEIGGKEEGGQRRSLGKKLAVQRDRVIGRYRIVVAGEHAKTLRWKLMHAADPTGDAGGGEIIVGSSMMIYRDDHEVTHIIG
jgi:putative DNA primase/helicase